ncbi:MAG TPA: hypothetical protein VKR31_12860 [Rhizomicrobium sp.]|nr:hypothetical protein [Rhizomicrobium sp.]
MEQPGELRELASWYRSWAELGNKADRGWREGFAEYLDQRAAEIERLLTLARKRAMN